MDIDIGTIALGRVPGRPSRLLLVVGLYDDGIAQVVLLTNEVDLATATDVLLEPELSGLPYRLLVETDLTAPCAAVELAGLAVISESDVDALLATEGVGLPCLSRRDGRWRWKESELADIHTVCERTMRRLL